MRGAPRGGAPNDPSALTLGAQLRVGALRVGALRRVGLLLLLLLLRPY